MRLDKENQGIRPPGRERSAVESRRLGGPAGEIMLAARTLFERRGVGHSVLLANTLLYATAWGFVAVVAMPAA